MNSITNKNITQEINDLSPEDAELFKRARNAIDYMHGKFFGGESPCTLVEAIDKRLGKKD